MARIVFEKRVYEAKLLNPFLNFALDTQLIEFRRDPLTGGWCRINVRRAERVLQTVGGEDGQILMEILRSSRENCFFCSENIERSTPQFPSDLVPEGRLRVGSACLFPNLFPFGEHHAVAVFSEDHYLSPNEFSSTLIRDCVEVCLDYFKRVRMGHTEVSYCSINWNHMYPAGASIVHPHFQVLLDRRPTPRLEELIKGSQGYYDENGSTYWADLVTVEKNVGERIIGENDTIVWLTSFAPQGNNEVIGIFSDISSVSEMRERHVEALAGGLSKILRGYHILGVTSFNMSVFSGPLDRHLNHYSLNLKIISRPSPKPFYTSDGGFMERLHYEAVVEVRPEDVARRLREYF